MLYDATTLYIRVQPAPIRSFGVRYANHDDAIYTEECVEAFLCPSGNIHYYYEINVSPLNTVLMHSSSTDGPRDTWPCEVNGLTDYHCEGLVTRVAIDGELGVEGARGWVRGVRNSVSSLSSVTRIRRRETVTSG